MYKRILVPIDGSPAADRGLTEAIDLAKDQHAEIRLLHVVNEWLLVAPDASGANLGDVVRGMREDGDRLLDAAEARVRGAGVPVNTVLIEETGSQIGESILQQAADWPADLIVCGTHGRRGVRRLLMGSDAEYVVRHTQLPVLLLRSPEAEEPGFARHD